MVLTLFPIKGQKFRIDVYISSKDSYILVLNSTYCEVEFHPYSDQQLLLQVNGTSMMTLMKQTVEGYQVSINNRTINFSKEADPSILRSPSSGKVVSLRFKDDQFVEEKTCFMEIEVMKMIMELHTLDAGK